MKQTIGRVSQIKTIQSLPQNQTAKSTYALISVDDDRCEQHVYVRSLGLALAQRGCQVDIFTRRQDPDQPAIIDLAPGCRIVRLTAGPARSISQDELFEHLPAFLEAWLAFQSCCDRHYALIHTNYWLSGWVGLQLKSRLKLPLVHTYHSIGSVKSGDSEPISDLASARLIVEWACLQEADCVVATTPQEKIDLRWSVSRRGKIRVIPYGIDARPFSLLAKQKARQQLGISPKTKTILYVGCFDRRQGLETLIKGCAQLPKRFQLCLANRSEPSSSDERDRKRIKALVWEWGLESVTTSIEHIPQQQLPAYYAAADVCVVPSDCESFGLVAIEAMAAGTPVIASYVGKLQHTVVHGETGLLIPPGNPEALAYALWAVLSNSKLAQSWGEASSKRVQLHFNSATVAAQIHQLYQSLINVYQQRDENYYLTNMK
ncbi:MAG: glycosyltransferase [Hydrococcus sp. C42_A2020_068]|uniref:glycosyltransferase n=1 Tax=Pleurocapsa sp. PCC 7327 TaxID=118163 RepID=UPI00029F8F75|nr:glycosyltransferase [Pleurocapsa sp. PCC 7327]AFY77087.1 glycosyltransferase [Pleurocapsa sp. PCC 7327]MBF2022493.1 glycosyltransferase [Hydrococcus sp. C42_A2020_068]